MSTSPGQASEALTPSDPTAATASRIIKHMNAEHSASLTRYLQHYGHVWLVSARSPQLLSVDRSGMKIASTGPIGTSSSRGLHTTITFEPPLKADLSDARARLVEMDAEAREGLGRKEETVTTYILPQGAWVWAWWTFVAFAWLLFSNKASTQEGSWAMSTVFRYAPLEFRDFVRSYQPRILRLMVGVHALETAEMVTGKLRSYNVELWSTVWWAWTLSCLFEGFTVWSRFDGVVKAEKDKAAAKQH